MRRTDFEKLSRALWWAAFGETSAPKKRAEIERLVQVDVGLAYGEKLLDQEPRPLANVTGPSSGPIHECRVETQHARVEGTNRCRCGRAYYAHKSGEEEAAAARDGLLEITSRFPPQESRQ
jgi:hypothetical protein